MNKLKLFVAILLLYPHLYVFACVEFPLEARVPPTKLIDRTSNIVLAVVVSARMIENSDIFYLSYRDHDFPGNAEIVRRQADIPRIEYSFMPLKTLKGNISSDFKVLGSSIREGDFTSYENHSSRSNSNVFGRLYPVIGCDIIPSFTVGGTYLVFLDEPYHSKGFEYISDYRNDEWLEYVEEEISN